MGDKFQGIKGQCGVQLQGDPWGAGRDFCCEHSRGGVQRGCRALGTWTLSFHVPRDLV